MKLLGEALATSSQCYFTALSDKNAFLFGLSSEGGGGGGLFVMRLRSMHIRKVGPSSLRSREDRSRAYSLSFNPYIFPLFIVFSHPSHGFSTGMLVTSSLWNTF